MVGAGVGGLVAALQLASQGVRVTVVERAEAPGGKMRQVMAGGAAIDAGPTVFTMRWVFEEIFAAAGVRLEDRISLSPLNTLARHAWRGGSRLDLHADREQSAEAIGHFAGPAEARRFVAFCEQARKVYATLEKPYIRSPRPTLLGLGAGLGPRGLAVLAGLGPFASLWRSLARHFHDPRLQQLFGRYATYCGASPFEAPATLMLIAQVEMDGVWQVHGGMHALARALADLATERGADLLFGRQCTEIVVRGGRVCGVKLLDPGASTSDARVLDADAVVFNGDVAALADGLLGAEVTRAVPATPRSERSLSALTWALHARASGFPLVRHNVFFDDDYASEFDDIFRRGRLPQRGTVYVCAQDQTDADAPPWPSDRPQRLLCLVNAPANGDGRAFTSTEIDACEKDRFALLAHCGLQIERPLSGSLSGTAQAVRTGPAEFETLFPATGGALYGQASHGWMASFRRPGSSCRVPGLFLAGGSVHPGPGVPMAAMSGRLAAATLMAHLDSTNPSRRVATSGGTSTPSVTTAATD